MLAYGQTGSGKTFTISGILDRIAYDLFRERDPNSIKIYFSLFELLGNQVWWFWFKITFILLLIETHLAMFYRPND